MISREEFERLVAEEFPHAIAPQFRGVIKNVALLVEDKPSEETRKEEGLSENETLLGLYRGIPAIARGDFYGVGGTLPDTITLYQLPIEEEADFLLRKAASAEDVFHGTTPLSLDRPFQKGSAAPANHDLDREDALRKVIRETIWHEVAHHFGWDETSVRRREHERDGE